MDLISFALRAAGVLGVGQTALPDDYGDCFAALNGMLGIWSRKRWMIWHLIDVSCIATGAQSYTVGPACDFDCPRPDRLEGAFFRQTVPGQPNQIDYQLDLIGSREDYNLIALKDLTSWPTRIFYDSIFPVGVVYPWPVPQPGLYELHITIKDTLTRFKSPFQQVDLPPEYTEALWTNLAIRIGALYPGVQVTEAVQALAQASMATIRGANTQIGKLHLPIDLGRNRYNIYSNQGG